MVRGIICRTTLIPPHEGEEGGVMAAQPVSLGDILVNITSNSTSLNMDDLLKVAGFDPDGESSEMFRNHFRGINLK